MGAALCLCVHVQHPVTLNVAPERLYEWNFHYDFALRHDGVKQVVYNTVHEKRQNLKKELYQRKRNEDML